MTTHQFCGVQCDALAGLLAGRPHGTVFLAAARIGAGNSITGVCASMVGEEMVLHVRDYAPRAAVAHQHEMVSEMVKLSQVALLDGAPISTRILAAGTADQCKRIEAIFSGDELRAFRTAGEHLKGRRVKVVRADMTGEDVKKLVSDLKSIFEAQQQESGADVLADESDDEAGRDLAMAPGEAAAEAEMAADPQEAPAIDAEPQEQDAPAEQAAPQPFVRKETLPEIVDITPPEEDAAAVDGPEEGKGSQCTMVRLCRLSETELPDKCMKWPLIGMLLLLVVISVLVG